MQLYLFLCVKLRKQTKTLETMKKSILIIAVAFGLFGTSCVSHKGSISNQFMMYAIDSSSVYSVASENADVNSAMVFHVKYDSVKIQVTETYARGIVKKTYKMIK